MAMSKQRFQINMRPYYTRLIEEFPNNVPTLVLDKHVDTEIAEGVPALWGRTEEGFVFIIIRVTDVLDGKMESFEYAISQIKEVAIEDFPFSIFTDFSIKRRIKDIYQMTMDISDLLGIPVPPVYIAKNEAVSAGTQGATSIGEYPMVFVVDRPMELQRCVLAHELRHWWQHIVGWQTYILESDSALTSDESDEYFFHPSEIDANAFSIAFADVFWNRDAIATYIKYGDGIFFDAKYRKMINENVARIKDQLIKNLAA